MHWIAFAILLYLVTVLQTTVAPFIAVHTIRPDLMVIVAVHYALLARAHDALIACWFTGLAIDLTSLSYLEHSNVGVNAVSLGLLAIVIINVRELTFRESAITQLVMTFVTKLALAILVGLHGLWAVGPSIRLGDVVTHAIWAAIYTAILTPYGHWILRRFRTVLGIGVTHHLRVR